MLTFSFFMIKFARNYAVNLRAYGIGVTFCRENRYNGSYKELLYYRAYRPWQEYSR